jgi:hypothetical protein
MGEGLARCSTCGTGMRWIVLESGERNPLEPEELEQPDVGLVAVSPRTGRGKVLSRDDLESGRAARWKDQGAAFYRSHFASARCAAAQRVHPQQGTLL